MNTTPLKTDLKRSFQNFFNSLRRAGTHAVACLEGFSVRHDLVHKKEILKLLDELELTPTIEVAIGVSALHTLESGVNVLNSIRERYNKKTPFIAQRADDFNHKIA